MTLRTTVFDKIWEAECEFAGLEGFIGESVASASEYDELFDSIARKCQALTRLALGYPAVNPYDEYIDFGQYDHTIEDGEGMSLEDFGDTLDETTKAEDLKPVSSERFLDEIKNRAGFNPMVSGDPPAEWWPE